MIMVELLILIKSVLLFARVHVRFPNRQLAARGLRVYNLVLRWSWLR